MTFFFFLRLFPQRNRNKPTAKGLSNGAHSSRGAAYPRGEAEKLSAWLRLSASTAPQSHTTRHLTLWSILLHQMRTGMNISWKPGQCFADPTVTTQAWTALPPPNYPPAYRLPWNMEFPDSALSYLGLIKTPPPLLSSYINCINAYEILWYLNRICIHPHFSLNPLTAICSCSWYD